MPSRKCPTCATLVPAADANCPSCGADLVETERSSLGVTAVHLRDPEGKVIDVDARQPIVDQHQEMPRLTDLIDRELADAPETAANEVL